MCVCTAALPSALDLGPMIVNVKHRVDVKICDSIWGGRVLLRIASQMCCVVHEALFPRELLNLAPPAPGPVQLGDPRVHGEKQLPQVEHHVALRAIHCVSGVLALLAPALVLHVGQAIAWAMRSWARFPVEL